MPRNPAGKRFSPRRQARRALQNAETRASQKESPAEQVETLRRGFATAISWLDGTHPKLHEVAGPCPECGKEGGKCGSKTFCTRRKEINAAERSLGLTVTIWSSPGLMAQMRDAAIRVEAAKG